MNELRIVLVAWVLGLCLVFGGFAVVADAAEPTSPDLPHQTADDDDDDDDQADTATYLEELAGDEGDTDVEQEEISAGELRDLEDRLEGLSDEIFKSRATLRQLRDQLEYTTVSVTNAGVYHTQATSGVFRVLSVQYALDGFDIWQATNKDGQLSKAKRVPIFEGSLVPGEHLLVVDIYYQGRGFGMFSYLNNYTFHVKSRYTFVIEEGEAFDLDVTAYDRAEFFAPLKDRLKVKFVRVSRDEE